MAGLQWLWMLLSRPLSASRKCVLKGTELTGKYGVSVPKGRAIAPGNENSKYGGMVFYQGGASTSSKQVKRWLLSTPGVSSLVLETRICPLKLRGLSALRYLLDGVFNLDLPSLEKMSLAAYNQALKLSTIGYPILGVGFSSHCASMEFPFLANRFIVSTRTADQLRIFTVSLSMGLRGKEQEDEFLNRLLFKEIMKACGISMKIDLGLTEDEFKSILEREVHYSEHMQLLQVIRGETYYKIYPFSRGTKGGRKIILSGSFNPLLDDHIKLLEVAASICGDGYPCFEISAIDRDGLPLCVGQIQHRVKQFEKLGKTIIISKKTSFVDKAKLFPGSCFVIGTDTLSRLLIAKGKLARFPHFFEYFALWDLHIEPRRDLFEKIIDGSKREYYKNIKKHGKYFRKIEEIGKKKMQNFFSEFKRRGGRFLVVGQSVNGTFKVLEDFDVPYTLTDMFIPIPVEMFRMD